jgi:hypothetical protein
LHVPQCSLCKKKKKKRNTNTATLDTMMSALEDAGLNPDYID